MDDWFACLEMLRNEKYLIKQTKKWHYKINYICIKVFMMYEI